MSHASEASSLTPREVAALADVSRRSVEKAIEENVLPVRSGPIKAVRFGKNVDARRLLGPESVAFVAALKSLGPSVSLSTAAKKDFAKALQEHRPADMHAARVEIAPALIADIGRLAGAALERMGHYLKARDAWIVSEPGIKGGLPVIKNTRISVHSVEARVRHAESLEEIARENPDVPMEAFEAAVLFAKTHPLAGRAGALSRKS